MIEKSILDLKFVKCNSPIPTLEVDLDSIPEDIYGYSDIITRTLKSIISTLPQSLASIYIYQGQSVNFGALTFSAFIGVAGQKNLLEPLLNAFRKIAGVKVRLSDYIKTSTGICEFHVQDGFVWRPVDELTWFTEIEEHQLGNDSSETDKPNNFYDIDSAVDTRSSSPVRYRTARADASVGGIIKTIEEIFGLPEGSVALRGPEGNALRSDAKIATLRKRWE